MRLIHGLGAIFLGVFAACTGSIETGGGGDDVVDPPRNDVRVVIKDANAPTAGVRVIFQNADDSVISEGLTDATGTASAVMTTGNVTVVRTYPVVIPVPAGGQRVPEIYTYVGVKSGDVIELGKAEPLTTPTPGAIVVKVPDTQGTVTVKTPCGSGSGTAPNVAITVSNCPAMMDLYVTQADASFYMKAPYGENIDVSAGVLSEALASTISAINVPESSSVEVDQKLYAGTFELFATGNKRIDQTPQQADMPTVSGVDAVMVMRVNTTGRGTLLTGSRSAYSGSGVMSIDASAHLMPYVMGNVQYTPTGISWLEVGAGTADAVMVTLAVTRGGAGGGTPASDAEYVRAVIAPHGGMQVRLPMLPESLYNPTNADQIGGALGLLTATGGYDALRGKAFAAESVVEMAPLGGSITLSYSGQAPGL